MSQKSNIRQDMFEKMTYKQEKAKEQPGGLQGLIAHGLLLLYPVALDVIPIFFNSGASTSCFLRTVPAH